MLSKKSFTRFSLSFCKLSSPDKRQNTGINLISIRQNKFRYLTNHSNIYDNEDLRFKAFLNNQRYAEDIFYNGDYRFRIIKRVFDIIFTLAIIAFILSWLIPVIVFLIKLESKGPAFFIQLRSGRNNTSFKCYKFRSMFVNADCNTLQTAEDDPRITRIGAFLRKTSLDELPQFFNVFLGQMSIVGPRPHMLSQTKHYAMLIDKFMVRHFIKPGITGWAQINGLRGQTKTVEEMLDRVEADVWYISNWSLGLDLRIILATTFKLLAGDENAF